MLERMGGGRWRIDFMKSIKWGPAANKLGPQNTQNTIRRGSITSLGSSQLMRQRVTYYDGGLESILKIMEAP